MRLCFLTSTPLNVELGSGTYTGITTLARALRAGGDEVDVVSGPSSPTTSARIQFNQQIAQLDYSRFDATIGFDLDGYLLPCRSTTHIACLKGVLADEVRFETGAVRHELNCQAELERLNVDRADYVVTTSRYSAARIRVSYAYSNEIGVIPELIDLEEWSRLFALVGPPAYTPARSFSLLSVCRFYPRKRLSLLLNALALVRDNPQAPTVTLHLVGDGVESISLQRQAKRLDLGQCCTFVGDVTAQRLAAEYLAAGAFVFPSAQEGFGIVLLEAMAAGKAIVATRSAAIPEVAPHALFASDDSPSALAQAMVRIAVDAPLRERIAACGRDRARMFDAPVVAHQFRELVSTVVLRRRGAFSSAGESTSIDPGTGG